MLDIVKVTSLALDFELNINITKLFWPLYNGSKLYEGSLPIPIKGLLLGVKLLDGAVSRDVSFISRQAMKRFVNIVDLMHLIPQLCDPESEIHFL